MVQVAQVVQIFIAFYDFPTEGDGQQMATDGNRWQQSTHSLDSSQSRQICLFQMGQAKDTGNKLFQEGAWFMELHGKLRLDGNPN